MELRLHRSTARAAMEENLRFLHASQSDQLSVESESKRAFMFPCCPYKVHTWRSFASHVLEIFNIDWFTFQLEKNRSSSLHYRSPFFF